MHNLTDEEIDRINRKTVMPIRVERQPISDGRGLAWFYVIAIALVFAVTGLAGYL